MASNLNFPVFLAHGVLLSNSLTHVCRQFSSNQRSNLACWILGFGMAYIYDEKKIPSTSTNNLYVITRYIHGFISGLSIISVINLFIQTFSFFNSKVANQGLLTRR